MSAPLGNRFWEQRSTHGRKVMQLKKKGVIEGRFEN